jgi:hypothetical protein
MASFTLLPSSRRLFDVRWAHLRAKAVMAVRGFREERGARRKK